MPAHGTVKTPDETALCVSMDFVLITMVVDEPKLEAIVPVGVVAVYLAATTLVSVSFDMTVDEPQPVIGTRTVKSNESVSAHTIGTVERTSDPLLSGVKRNVVVLL